MKKFNISILFVITMLIGVYFAACNKDDFSEKDALLLQAQLNKVNDSTANLNKTKVDYSILIVDASTSTLKSTSALTGATIKLTQNGVTITKTDSAGIVAFNSLKIGTASVKITMTGYATVDYIVNLSSANTAGSQYGTIIPMLPITGSSMATIQGKVTCETDLTNKVPEPAAGVKVIATINTGSSAAIPATGGTISNISYGGISLEATTQSDGTYSMKVPATINGLTYDVKVTDFTADQKVLMTSYKGRDTLGLLTIPTYFGSYVSTSASTVPSASPVFVIIGAPDYTFVPAVATAVTDNNNGIENIQITNNGDYYTQGTYSIAIDNPKTSATVTAAANFTVNAYGRVTSISVSSSGSDYPTSAENFDFTIPYASQEAVITISTVNGSGGITGVSVTNGGRYYIDVPDAVFFSNNGTGTGAKFTPTFAWSGSYYYISGVVVDPSNLGTGYAASGTLNVKVNASLNQPMTGKLHMTKGNVSAISLSNQGTNYISGKVDVVIDGPGSGGTTATATATVNNGKITSISLTNNGSGYTSTPAVTIVNKIEKVQAKANATVNANGNVTSVTVTVAGSGYLTAPAITLAPVVAGIGSGASAYSTLSSGGVGSILLINGGTGYVGSNYPTAVQNSPASTSSGNVKGSGTTIVNIVLGTGKRSIEN